jgi:rhodanese-related sulfurtransferase
MDKVMKRSLSPAELAQLLTRRRDVVVFDVRRKDDYGADQQKVAGAMWLDPERVAQWSTALPHDKQVVIYCARGGSVSNSVVDYLQGKGVKACFIEGGIEAWKAAGGATVAKG